VGTEGVEPPIVTKDGQVYITALFTTYRVPKVERRGVEPRSYKRMQPQSLPYPVLRVCPIYYIIIAQFSKFVKGKNKGGAGLTVYMVSLNGFTYYPLSLMPGLEGNSMSLLSPPTLLLF
jgi:hypothetical protein